MASRIQDAGAFAREEIKRFRGWLIGLGVLLIALGVVAIGHALTSTVVSMTLLGWLLAIGGVVQIVHAFSAARWGGFFLTLLEGVLYVVVGALMASRPVEAALTLTLLLAAFLMIGGLFRVFAAPIAQLPNWGWIMASGIVSFLLGIAIWARWPGSGLWFLGVYVGLEMILYGVSLLMLGVAVREVTAPFVRRQAA